MKKTRFAAISLVLALAAALLLCACGGGASSEATAYDTANGAAQAPAEAGFGWDDGATEVYSEEEAMEAPAADVAHDEAGAPMPGLTQPQDDRKLIMNAWMSLEALEFDKTCRSLQQAVGESGGYVSYTDISGSAEAADRYAQFTIRVPAENYTAFMEKMDAAGNVVSRSEQSQDVTDQYVDLEARLSSLRTQEERLLKMMEETAKLSDIIEVQNQLAEVQYQIESYEGSRRSLENLVSYSTVDVTVTEVQEATTVGEIGYGQEVAEAFRNSWRAVVRFLQDVGVGLVWLVPVLLTLVIIAVPVLIVVFIVLRAARKRRAERAKNAPATPAWPAVPPYPVQQPPAAEVKPGSSSAEDKKEDK